jgi:hypothetical protein
MYINIYTYKQESEAVYLSGLDSQNYVMSSKEFSVMAQTPRYLYIYIYIYYTLYLLNMFIYYIYIFIIYIYL